MKFRITQRTDLQAWTIQLIISCSKSNREIFNILERTRHFPMLNSKTDVHIVVIRGKSADH
jgi:hypothetical protein